MAFAWNMIGVEFRADGKFSPDFNGQLGCASFIGINADHPVVIEKCNRVIAQFAEAGEWYVNMAHAKLRADLRRVVRTERIHHDDFVGPQNRGQNFPQLGGGLKGDDVNAYGFGHGKVN